MPVKDELKKTIQSRRMERGLGYLRLPPEQPKPLEQLSSEELGKRQRKRERNKIAASRCRLRRKERLTNLQKMAEELKATNHKVEKDIEKLRAQKEKLVDMLSSHHCTKTSKRTAGNPLPGPPRPC